METLTDEELRKLEMARGGLFNQGEGTYGPSCGATSSYNCYSICDG